MMQSAEVNDQREVEKAWKKLMTEKGIDHSVVSQSIMRLSGGEENRELSTEAGSQPCRVQ